MPGGLHSQVLPDIVRDSKLETQIFSSYTQHIFYISGYSARERHIRNEERWVRDRFLGQGAYGTVYLERCEQGDDITKLRAVKEIRKSVHAGNEFDYTRELEAIAKFSHPNYAHCFVRSDGWFENDYSIFITMEYLEHGDLLGYISTPIPEPEARDITSQVLEGLKFMHENNFVHRDLKPGNIMVVTPGPEWFVKIADFGTSKRRQQDVTSLHTLQRGTLGFGAPEAIGLIPDSESKSYTFAVDMWSLGAVVYRMLANTTPFPTYLDILHYIGGTAGFPIDSLRAKSVTRESQEFIIALMSPDPAARPSSISADRHPWMMMSLPLATDDVKPRDTEIPTASADSSLASGHSEDHIRGPLESRAEIPDREQTTNPDDEVSLSHITSLYRSPYVEDCNDEYGGIRGQILSSDSPYVLDDADASPISKDLHSSSPPTPPPDYNVVAPNPNPMTTTPSLSIKIPEAGSLPQDTFERLSTPYSIQKSEKTNIFAEINPGRSKSMGEGEERPKGYNSENPEPPSQHHRSNGAREASRLTPLSSSHGVNTGGFAEGSSSKRRDKFTPIQRPKYDNDEPGGSCGDTKLGHKSSFESLLVDNEVRNHRHALSSGIARFNDKTQKMLLLRQGYGEMSCAYCFAKDYPDGTCMIERVECGHWICHYCLMERFALALVSKDYKLRCCGVDIYLQSFSRILVDPEINRLWTAGYVRENTEPGPDDDFIITLYNKAIIRNPQILQEIRCVTGLSLDDSTPNGDARRQTRNGHNR